MRERTLLLKTKEFPHTVGDSLQEVNMYKIRKISSESTVDFAAEELKKYLRMMMPEAGDMLISYDPKATDGFRIGIMADMGLDTPEITDPATEDVIYIDTDKEGGVIAGSNPASALVAVYEYLRQNGCRWLMSGVDGEYIPMREIVPVKYRHKPSCLCRAHCWEGGLTQRSVLDIIDLSPKLGLSSIMLEHNDSPWYYKHNYERMHSSDSRKPEKISQTTVIQWKRAAEAEIAKRSLHFHNIGHGWTSKPFEDDIEGNKKYLAMLNGKRDVYRSPVYTNFCMSNEQARAKVVRYVADYTERHSNTDYMHIWLADLYNNHCECEECVKMSPSDWYMVLMNEIDAALCERKIDMRLVFIVYVDTTWAPTKIKLNRPDRFVMLFAPITRSYTETLPETPREVLLRPYERNKLTLPADLEESLAYLAQWREWVDAPAVGFEYHFWRHLALDPSGIFLSRRINEDIKAYLANGIDGLIEDGTFRPFFPNGLAFYTYARTLYDTSLSAEEIAEEYFECAYGEDWREFYRYLEKLGELFDFAYLEGERSANPEISKYYDPARVEKLRRIEAVADEGMELIQSHYNSDHRIQTVSVRLLEQHNLYVRMLAKALIAKAQGNDEQALELYNALRSEFGRREIVIEPYYDHFEAMNSLLPIFRLDEKSKKPIIV